MLERVNDVTHILDMGTALIAEQIKDANKLPEGQEKEQAIKGIAKSMISLKDYLERESAELILEVVGQKKREVEQMNEGVIIFDGYDVDQIQENINKYLDEYGDQIISISSSSCWDPNKKDFYTTTTLHIKHIDAYEWQKVKSKRMKRYGY